MRKAPDWIWISVFIFTVQLKLHQVHGKVNLSVRPRYGNLNAENG